MFDRTDPADLTALKTEVNTDPLTIGYVIDPTATLISQLNAKNYTVQRAIDDVDIYEVAAVINDAEYDALPAYGKEWVKMFIVQPEGIKTSNYKTKFLELFPNGSVTRTAAIALLDVPGSRAEVLFGYGTVITRDDWAEARRNG